MIYPASGNRATSSGAIYGQLSRVEYMHSLRVLNRRYLGMLDFIRFDYNDTPDLGTPVRCVRDCSAEVSASGRMT